MQDAHHNTSFDPNEEDVNIKEILLKYFRFWPWFIAAVTVTVLMAFLYLKYTPTVYSTEAKIKIIDDSKELNIGADALSMLSGKPKINLDNEIEVLKSYRLLSQVVETLDLQVDYLVEGNIKTTPVWEAPFKIIHTATADTLSEAQTYAIRWDASQFYITDAEGHTFNQSKVTATPTTGLPFYVITNPSQNNDNTKKYKVNIKPFKQTVMDLAKNIEVQSTNKNSEILAISLKGASVARSEAIINEIIDKFNNDGIQDRQLVSKRTLNFIDERFIYLSEELDSIEGNKKSFKQDNNLSYIEADAGISLQKKSDSEAELFRIETQIELSNLLKKTLTNDAPYNLLPANIGLESSAINDLVSEYNQTLLEREKLLSSAGANNPTVKVLNVQIASAKANIEQTVTVYAQQLKMGLQQLQREKGRVGAQFSSLPEKEQLLRAIERQQSIKENLYLILLQKREEAAISLAVTAPSIKVVDYALTSSIPVAPKSKIILLGAIILGLLIPFGILYVIFMLDTKIHNRQEVEAIIRPIPVVAEIPFIEGGELFINPDARTTVAEAFRMLMTNINYTLPPTETQKARVVYVTSSIKGEGKTFTAINLSLAYSSLNKRVLLIGADIRNPQVHTYFQLEKDKKGLTSYLFNPSITAKDCIIKNESVQGNLHLMLGGSIPPNPASLLSNGRFGTLLKELESEYDVIVVDTAPTVLVTDTLLISKHADATVYVAKANYTDKNLLEIPKNFHDEKKLRNIVFVINNAGQSKHYSYNYNYGYGYNEDTTVKKPWYKRFLKS
ncbi:GumC family protein [Mariniflexile ostreae]|uniref:non-specific protein-tyrosine kinase n=1 Tax=Mariniflexile ostreae TaxID=1520892 RepID=A0ABV5FC78_9FLAO